MSGENCKVQVNLKVGNNLLNLYAVNVAELNALADEASRSPWLAPFFGSAGKGDVPASARTTQPAGPEPTALEKAKAAVGTAPVEPEAEEAPLDEAEAVAALKEELGATEATEEEAPAEPVAVDPLALARERMKGGK